MSQHERKKRRLKAFVYAWLILLLGLSSAAYAETDAEAHAEAELAAEAPPRRVVEAALGAGEVVRVDKSYFFAMRGRAFSLDYLELGLLRDLGLVSRTGGGRDLRSFAAVPVRSYPGRIAPQASLRDKALAAGLPPPPIIVQGEFVYYNPAMSEGAPSDVASLVPPLARAPEFKRKSQFVPGIELDDDSLRARWQGVVVDLALSEYVVLAAILTMAPKSAPVDKIIRYGAGIVASFRGNAAQPFLTRVISRLNNKFRLAKIAAGSMTEYLSLRVVRNTGNVGYYWHEMVAEETVWGSLVLVPSHSTARWYGLAIRLNRGEIKVLTEAIAARPTERRRHFFPSRSEQTQLRSAITKLMPATGEPLLLGYRRVWVNPTLSASLYGGAQSDDLDPGALGALDDEGGPPPIDQKPIGLSNPAGFCAVFFHAS
jgi:hypothetical protein